MDSGEGSHLLFYSAWIVRKSLSSQFGLTKFWQQNIWEKKMMFFVLMLSHNDLYQQNISKFVKTKCT